MYVHFTPDQPRMLVLAVLCLAIAGYFSQIPEKTRDLRFLIGAFSLWTVHFVIAVFRETFLPITAWSDIVEICAGFSGLVTRREREIALFFDGQTPPLGTTRGLSETSAIDIIYGEVTR